MTRQAFNPRVRAGQGVDRRLMAAGVVAGAAVGAAVGARLRRQAPSAAEAPGLVDWEQARSIAVSMNRGWALTAPERERLDREYRDLVARCEPLITAYTGDSLPATLVRTFAFDRVDWVNANLLAFQTLFAPIEAIAAEEAGRSVFAQLWGGVNRTVVSAEVGLLLGYLARRVLGQYDLALLGREPVTGGKLYFVEPNIRQLERTLGLPSDQFRLWLALHESSHAFEFEAHPWVRLYFNSLLEEYFVFLKSDIDQLRNGFGGLRAMVQRVRSDDSAESWLEALMVPEQRAIFARMQAMMCIVEGYSNHVMNAVGRDLMPNFAEIQRRFEARKSERGKTEQLFARLTGLDMKLEQYRLGEAFFETIAKTRGHNVAKRVWEGPQFLPTMEEIRTPALWLQRIDDQQNVPDVPIAVVD